MVDRATPAGTSVPPDRPAPPPWRRLGPPPGAPSVALAVLLALAGGGLGGAMAAWSAWPTTQLPDTAAATQLVSTTFPDQPARVVERQRAPFDYRPAVRTGVDRFLVPILGGSDYGPAAVELVVEPVPDPSPALARAADRLSGAGWHVRGIATDDFGKHVEASDGHRVITLSLEPTTSDTGIVPDTYEPTVRVSIGLVPPSGLRLPALAGWLAGLLTGWLLAVAVTRIAAARRGQRRTALAVANLGLLLSMPASLAATWAVVAYQLGTEPDRYDPLAPWEPYMVAPLRIPAVLGVLLLGTAASVIAARRPTDRSN